MVAQRLIRPSDIASLAGVSAAAVANWRARSMGFPDLAGGTTARPLYDYGAVVAWLRASGKKVREATAADLLWSFMDTVRNELRPDQAGRLVLSLLVVHKAALSSSDVASLWAEAKQVCAADSEAALSDLFRGAADLIPGGHGMLDDSWPRTEALGRGLSNLLIGLERISEADLSEAASAVVDRMARAQGRMTGLTGAVDSAPAQLLASLATRRNLVVTTAGKSTKLTGEAHATVADAMPEILDLLSPTPPIGSVYDPACGISEALFTIHATRPEVSLTGREINADILRVARQRAFLDGIEADLEVADTLLEDPWPGGLADAVVAEPPLGSPSREKLPDIDKRWQFGTPNGPATDLAWLQDAVAHLSSSGRGYVLQPGGSLFRAGSAGAIRRELVAAGCIEAVIALPANLLTYTGIPLFAVVLCPTTDPAQSVTFIDASTSGGVRHTTVALADVLGAADANLSPAMHLADASVADVDFSAQAKASWLAIAETVDGLRATTVPTLPRVNFAGTRVMSIGELVKSGVVREMWRGSVKPGKGGSTPDGVVRPQHVRDGLPDPADGELAAKERLTAPGDVLLTTQINIQSAVDETGGHAVSNQVTVLSLHPDALRSRFVALAIKGEWNERFLMGSAIKRANVKDLEIPLPSLGVQDEIAVSVSAAAALATAADEACARTSAFVTDVMAAVRYGANLNPDGA